MVRLSRTLVALSAVALLAAACGSPSRVAQRSTQPVQASSGQRRPQSNPTAMASESAAPSVAVVATIPPDQLDIPGPSRAVSDMPYPPQEYSRREQGKPIGSDIEIGEGIAASDWA